MKIQFSVVLMFFSAITLSAQIWQLKDSIKIESKDSITDFDVDDFGNIYYIRNFYELNKIDAKTKKHKSFTNQTLLENLNTQNILQITVKSNLFHFLILDNQLNPIQDDIQFPIESNFSPTLFALVDNNYLWGYDPVLQRLVLWNYQEKRIFTQSVIINEKSGDEFFSELLYEKNKIYLIGYQKILVFDEYANLKEVIPFQKFDQITLKNNKIFYSFNGEISELNLSNKTTNGISISKTADNFSTNGRFLFVLKNKVVYIYDSQKEP